MLWLLVTILVGLIGAGIALKYKVPAGAMIGSLFAVAVFSVLTGKANLPQSYKIITQISTGAFIGSKIKAEDIKGLRYVLFPAITMVVLMALINFIMGFFICKFTDIDIVTALFATAPGGIADMTIISYDFGADSSKVAVLQLIRVISVIGIMPTLIKIMIKKVQKKEKLKNQETENKNLNNKNYSEKSSKPKPDTSFKENLKKVFITLFIGAVTGIFGYVVGIPAGAMSVSMAGVAAYNVFSSKAYMPIKLRQFIQVLAGALIGAKMTMGDIIGLKEIILPVFVAVIGFCLMNLVLGILIYKITDFNVQTSLFSASPGGMSDMSIIASELGADAPKVAVMQFLRLVSVVAFYPILIDFIKDFFS